MELYREEDFYKENGWPPEKYNYCDFLLSVDYEVVEEDDYDQFILVVNALYPYLRLSKKRGNSQWPCGFSISPSTTGWFASKTDEERNECCPQIAWGVVAWYMAYLSYSKKQQDYVLKKEQTFIFQEYYNRFWNIYKSNHSGLKYSKISIEQKELSFLSEHRVIESNLWDKSTPLKTYQTLYNYAKEAREEYELFLIQRIKELDNSMAKKNNCFSTQISKTFDTEYVKVFFLDDSVAPKAQEVVMALNCVKNVNISEYKGTAHPGQSLTVYPKSMVTVQKCDKDVNEALNQFFSKGIVIGAAKPIKNDILFNNIANGIIEDLNKARVSIHVAMAWFTNQVLADKLVEKFNEGVDVKVVSFEHPVNTRFGVNIGAIPHKIIRGTRGGTMHDKFCVIDNQFVITGSYNWSDNAENKNDENVTIMRDYKSASDYSVEFRRLFESV